MIEGQDVREQPYGHPLRIGSGVASGVFERVHKHGDELAVVGRFRDAVGGERVAGQEGGLCRPRVAIGLHPAAAGAVQGPSPNADPPWRQRDIGDFEDDAADVLIGEEVLVGELEAVQHAEHIEEEGLAPPAGEKAVLPDLCYARHPTQRDRRRFDEHVSRVAYPGGRRTPDAAQRRRLRPSRKGGKPHPVGDVCDGIAVGVDLELVDRLMRERVWPGGPARIQAERWMHIHDQDRLAILARFPNA